MTTTPSSFFLHSFSPSQLSDTLSAYDLRGLSQRALLMANANDTVCCDQLPDADYIAYLKDFDIAPQHIIVPKVIAREPNSSLAQRLLADPPLLKQLRQQHHILEPYMATTTEWQVAQTLDYRLNGAKADYSAYLNQKTHLNHLLAESNLPYLPMQSCHADTLQATALHAYKRYGKLVIRASLGLGSQNVWLIKREDDIQKVHAIITQTHYDEQRTYVISPFIDHALSLNIQFLLSPNSIDLIGLSQQYIDDALHYHGNYKATLSTIIEQQVLTQGHQLASYLQRQGYRGYIGFDLLVKQNKSFIIEINPRVNTSTFTLIGVKRIMGSLDNTCFASASLAMPKTIHTFQQLQQALQAQNILLTPDQQTGILPLMSPIAHKKIDIMLIAPTHHAIQQLLHQTQQLTLS